jgi:hypothetical protein
MEESGSLINLNGGNKVGNINPKVMLMRSGTTAKDKRPIERLPPLAMQAATGMTSVFTVVTGLDKVKRIVEVRTTYEEIRKQISIRSKELLEDGNSQLMH